MCTLILAVLASRVGRPVPLPELVDALWGDQPPASAGNNLRTYVSGLRRTLGAGSLTGSGTPGYTLQVSTEDIDMHEFLAPVSGGQAALDAELPNLVAACIHAAGDGPSPAAWLIADALRGYCYYRRDLASWGIIAGTALRAATAAGDQTGQARKHWPDPGCAQRRGLFGRLLVCGPFVLRSSGCSFDSEDVPGA
jgi:hypothetical protein